MPIVVIADIVESRTLENRTEYQKQFADYLRILSFEKRSDLLSPYTVTLGDEFQAVFSEPSRLLQDALSIVLAFPQRPIRFCFGIGDLSTAVNSEMALGMDGPAFIAARQVMERQKKEKRTVIGFAGEFSFGLINTSLRIWSGEWEKWSINTRKAFAALVHGHSMEKVASDAGISLRAVYKAISLHGLKDYKELFGAICEELKNQMEVKR